MCEGIEQNQNTELNVLNEQSALVAIAQKMPRDEAKAISRIMDAAKRETVAENAIYAYQNGNQLVKRPSIRAAETLARYWGNIDFGIKELHRDYRGNFSEVMAYAWDLETNTRQVKTFKVNHSRLAPRVSSREIYEKVSNEGARCLRACILGLIPNDIVENFIVECEKTLAGDNSTPLAERAIAIILIFEELGISQALIEKRFACDFEQFNENQLVELRIIYKSIKDNFQSAEAFFDIEKKETPSVSVKNVFEDKDGGE